MGPFSGFGPWNGVPVVPDSRWPWYGIIYWALQQADKERIFGQYIYVDPHVAIRVTGVCSNTTTTFRQIKYTFKIKSKEFRGGLPDIIDLAPLKLFSQGFIGLFLVGSVVRKTVFYFWVTFRPFKVIQGHWFWYQLKARMRLPISPS